MNAGACVAASSGWYGAHKASAEPAQQVSFYKDLRIFSVDPDASFSDQMVKLSTGVRWNSRTDPVGPKQCVPDRIAPLALIDGSADLCL